MASMIAALLGMAGWLFLAPERSGWYGLLAACCFVALAAPRATLAWGAVGSIARSRLLATVAGPGLRSAPQWRVPITTAAILAWPPLVAAGVVGGEQATDRLWLVAEVLAWGVALAVVTTAALRLGAGRETVLAIALVTAVACFLGWRGTIGPETPGTRAGMVLSKPVLPARLRNLGQAHEGRAVGRWVVAPASWHPMKPSPRPSCIRFDPRS
jgi:hypothetical protein